FFVPFGAVVYSVINIKLWEHIVALCQFIHYLLSNRYKLITNVRSSLMAVNIHITIIELNALHTKRQNLLDRKSGSAGMPRPISYAVFCLKKKNITNTDQASQH